MKFILLILLMISVNGHAASRAHCRLVEGIYTNSSAEINEINFETLVDVFTLKNANTFSVLLENQRARFVRSEMSVDRQTKMTYFQRLGDSFKRGAYITLDRTPRQVALTRNFYGNIIIAAPYSNEIIGQDSLNYNFYCWF